MRTVLAAMLAVLLFAASAHGQTLGPIRSKVARVDYATFTVTRAPQLLAEKVPNKAERWILKGCMAFNIGGQAYDGATTIRAINSGDFREGNPALRWIGDKPVRIVPVKAAYAAGTTWGFVALAENHPRIAAAAACTSGAVSTWAGGTNRRKLQGR